VDRDCIQFCQPLGLENIFANKMRVEVLKVREADQLRDIGVIPDIPFFVRVVVAPFFCREPEESHVEKIGFGCVHPVDLGLLELFRDQVLFDRVRVNPVVDLCKVTPDIPTQLFAFLIFESLEFLDEVEFEFHRDPGREFKRDILVSIGTAMSSGFRNNPPGVCHLNPLFRSQGETIETGLFSKPVELDGIKIRVVELLPDAEKLDRFAVPEEDSDPVMETLCSIIMNV
jgi:hypothetical protein